MTISLFDRRDLFLWEQPSRSKLNSVQVQVIVSLSLFGDVFACLRKTSGFNSVVALAGH